MTMLGQPKRRRHIPVLHPVGSPHSGGEGSHRQSYHDEPSRPEPHVNVGRRMLAGRPIDHGPEAVHSKDRRRGEINLSVGFLEASDSPLLRLTDKVGKVPCNHITKETRSGDRARAPFSRLVGCASSFVSWCQFRGGRPI